MVAVAEVVSVVEDAVEAAAVTVTANRYDHDAPRGAKPEFEFPRDEAGRKRTHLQEEKFFPGGRAHRPGDDLPPEDGPGSTRSLFLGNLDRSLTREEIYSEFEEYGDILECD